MIRYEIFDGKKTYMFPNGELATPEVIKQKFPAITIFPHVLEINGNVIQAVMELQATRQIMEIPDDLTDEEIVVEMTKKASQPSTPPPPTPEERLAAAAEFQNLMMLPDVEVQ